MAKGTFQIVEAASDTDMKWQRESKPNAEQMGTLVMPQDDA